IMQSRITILDSPQMQRLSKIVLSAMVVLGLGLALTAGLAAWRWELGKVQADGGRGLRGWQPIGGHWTERAGVLSNSNYGRGDMLIARQPQGTNYRIAADL